MSKCQVILLDDHAVFRETLAKGLELAHQIKITGEAESSEQCLSLLKNLKCDVLVLDLSLSGSSGADVLSHIVQQYPGIAVLILSAHAPDHFIARLIRQGASGFVHKSHSLEHVAQSILRAKEGQLVIDNDLAEIIARHDQYGAELPHESLSNREHQVMHLLITGKTITQIGQELNLNVKTISTYRKRIMDKLGVKSNVDMLHYAIQNSLEK